MKKLRRYKATEVEVKKGGVQNYRFEKREIVLNENPMFLMMFRGLNINPDEVDSIDWMIKAKFNSKEEVLKNKDLYITIDEKRYYFYLSTPSDIKNNKAIYVREDVIPLVKQYESMVSCDWIGLLDVIRQIKLVFENQFRLSHINLYCVNYN